MIKSILVSLSGLASDRVALASAQAVASVFSGHLEALHVRADAIKSTTLSMGIDIVGGTPWSPEVLAAIEKDIVEWAAAAKKSFDAFAASAAPAASWREVVGDLVPELVTAARVHDLAVFGRAEDASARTAGEVLIRSGRPVLLAANDAPQSIGKRIAIAWKDTAEAARAVTAAMPLIEKAETVTILAAAEGDRDSDKARNDANALAGQLAWHDVKARTTCIVPEHDAAEALFEAALKDGADLLVMGGYGHSRMREFVFSGFTRHALAHAPLPILLCH